MAAHTAQVSERIERVQKYIPNPLKVESSASVSNVPTYQLPVRALPSEST